MSLMQFEEETLKSTLKVTKFQGSTHYVSVHRDEYIVQAQANPRNTV